MHILVFDTDDENIHLLPFAFESQIGAHVSVSSTLESTLALLHEDSPIDLIVVHENEKMPTFFKCLASMSSKIPVIIVGTTSNPQEQEICGIKVLAQLALSDGLKKISEIVAAQLKAKASVPSWDDNYCRINVGLLLRVGPLKGDVYLRLSNLKYVKMFKSGAVFTDRDLSRIWGVKKIDYLYIEKINAPDFVIKLNEEMTKGMHAAPEGDESQLLTLCHAQETIRDLATKIGFTEEIVRLTNTQVSFALKVIGKAPQLNKVIVGMLTKKESYLSEHSVQLGYVACCIAAKLEWPSDLTFQKLIFAAFFHDIVLFDARQAKIKSKQELLENKGTLTPEAYNLVENHMFLAGDVANRFPQVPSDVYQIIVQHHERPDGTGFPRGHISKDIAPLSAVFIVAHEIVDALTAEGHNFNMDRFWIERTTQNAMGTFKKIIKTFTPPADSEVA